MKNVSLTNQISKEVFNFSQKFTNHLRKQQQGNFREIVRGTLISGSTFLNQIAKVNSKTNNERKDIERLSNTLSKIDVDKFRKIHINSQASIFKNEPILILSDGGDYQKPHAKKMEEVCKNVDGDNGHKIGKGYWLHALMAYGLTSKNLMPLSNHLYSTLNENFKSEWDEAKKNFNDLELFIRNSSQDRIIVEDRGCDDKKRFLYFIEELEASFVTRIHSGAKSRKFLIKNKNGNNKMKTVQDLIPEMRKKAGSGKNWYNKKIKKDLISEIAFQKVYLPDRPEIPLYAIFCFCEEYDEPMVILTDLITKNFEQAWKHFFYYKKRWEVENFYRAIKTNFSAEDFLIENYEKIQALAFMVMLVFALLLLIKQKDFEFLGMIYELFKMFCKKAQRSGDHHLDILAFIRDSFIYAEPDYFYRFWSQLRSKKRYIISKNQIKLLDFRRNW